jgi:transcriptional regulator
MGKPTDLVQGTLALLIMRVIEKEPLHGWAIGKRIEYLSNETLIVQQGSLYPSLHKLEQQGWIKARWALADNGRRAKFYSLTRAGVAALADERSSWDRLAGGVNLVLRNA